MAGHAGCGHCHSHNGQVQDDSAGLATVLSIFQEAAGIPLTVKDIRVRTGMGGYIEVETEGGGTGNAFARRGFTPQEARLAEAVIGKEAICTQSLVLDVFGRIYGQGVHEAPVALQTAIANAALDTFVINYPSQFRSGYEGQQDSCGLIAGAVVDFDGIAVSVLGTVNASLGGVGPNEDLEGNVAIGSKKEIMAALGMTGLPTIVIEAMIYSAAYSKDLDQGSFLVKSDSEADNEFVAASIVYAANILGFPVLRDSQSMARIAGALEQKTQQLGGKISALGKSLGQAQYSREKVGILAELAELVSQDGGGISFMSNSLHNIVGGAGVMQGAGAVINYVVPQAYYDNNIIPSLTVNELCKYAALTKQAFKELYKVLPEAAARARKGQCQNLPDLFISPGHEV